MPPVFPKQENQIHSGSGDLLVSDHTGLEKVMELSEGSLHDFNPSSPVELCILGFS